MGIRRTIVVLRCTACYPEWSEHFVPAEPCHLVRAAYCSRGLSGGKQASPAGCHNATHRAAPSVARSAAHSVTLCKACSRFIKRFDGLINARQHHAAFQRGDDVKGPGLGSRTTNSPREVIDAATEKGLSFLGHLGRKSARLCATRRRDTSVRLDRAPL